MSPEETVETFLIRWAADPAGAMADMVARDIVYTLNVSPDAIQIGGETVGWDAVNAKMMAIRDVFDYLVFKPRIYGVRGDKVRSRIELIFRHKLSGELLTGQMRNEIIVRDGMIARVDEYVDAPLIESFMRMFNGAPAATEAPSET
jgi:ketosteroid isomerase-like protein